MDVGLRQISWRTPVVMAEPRLMLDDARCLTFMTNGAGNAPAVRTEVDRIGRRPACAGSPSRETPGTRHFASPGQL